jgi:hypothetical protein
MRGKGRAVKRHLGALELRADDHAENSADGKAGLLLSLHGGSTPPNRRLESSSGRGKTWRPLWGLISGRHLEIRPSRLSA